MKASDLKEAQTIVDSLVRIDSWLSVELYPKTNQLSVRAGEKGSETYLSISKEAAEAALAMEKRRLAARRDELKRRAAQIGLVLP